MRLGRHGLQPRREPVGDGDDAGRAADREPGRRADDARADGVLDVLAVGRDDERRAGGDHREQARRDEEVRVDDVGAEAARRRDDIARQRERDAGGRRAGSTTARSSSCPRSRSARLEVGHEGPELGRVGSRVHLGDEQDPHGLPGRDLDDAEAHLVRRALAPQDVAGRAAPQAHVVAARDPEDVARPGNDRLLELVHGLPVEVPARDLEQELRA